ncbi:MAG: nicotinate phosphoribosyltransferase [Candidatus Obscuribacterales bacterium]|nr:nicotinate phosphoribosyltransferase [Candidatus Obscuribacterales bacterium]
MSMETGARPSDIYRPGLATLTDLYQLTMAYGYFQNAEADKEREAVFHLSFRNNPFQGGYSVACGLESLIDLVENFHFFQEDLDYLSTLCGGDGKPIFSLAFLAYLKNLKLHVDIDAVPEGEIVFAHEPLVRVKGPIIECQLLETALLNFFNFQTLIATKAARVVYASQGRSVLEFGLRRAQGVDGALTASRAAYLGGCDATSNVLAGRLFGIPVKGTHAHSWVMSYASEAEAFANYAKAMPNNCVFLVDTYDTLSGVKHAIEAGRNLRAQGHELLGIRLDSGDLAYLSSEARKMLDEAGFHATKILASNDLDEEVIESLIDQGAAVDIWGVGTKLITAADQPALGGVYKLACVRDLTKDGKGPWQYRIKLSEQVIKISTPGVQQVRRFYTEERGVRTYLADMVYDEESTTPPENMVVDPLDFTRRKAIANGTKYEELLKPIFREGRLVYKTPGLEAARQYREDRLKGFHKGILRLLNPHQYPVGIEAGLSKAKLALIMKERGFEKD